MSRASRSRRRAPSSWAIQIGKEEFEAAVEKVYKKQRGKIKRARFSARARPPGKYPIRGHVHWTPACFMRMLSTTCTTEADAQAIEQEKLDAVAWPKVEIVDVGKRRA